MLSERKANDTLKRIVCLFSGHAWGPVERHEVRVTAYLRHRIEDVITISVRTCMRCAVKERI